MAERSGARCLRAHDRVIAELAERQFGVVTRAQLMRAGISDHAITHRLRTSRLHPLHRGVYAVGHRAVSEPARELAAMLACGDQAVVSHHAAAARWEIRPPRKGEIDITVPVGRNRRRPGVRVHRAVHLDARDIRTRGPLRLTAPARTVLDLAGELPLRKLEQAIAEARARGLIADGELEAALGHAPNRPGSRALRELLRAEREPALTRSEGEERLLGLVYAAGLPTPEVNVRMHGHELDMLWRDQRLVVELDGYAFHSSRKAFERDRRRDAGLQAAGLRVMRVTWRQVVETPEALLVQIAQALVAVPIRVA